MAAIMVNEWGVRPSVSVEEVHKELASGHFFWLDIVGESEALRTSMLQTVGLDGAEIVTILRFRQAGRMRIAHDRVRAVTWISDGEGALVEVHLASCAKNLVTVWSGDPTTLDPIRRHFAERVGGVQGDMHYAAGLLLQLLIETLDASLQTLDAQIDGLRMKLDQQAGAMDYSLISRELQRLQSFVASFSRYSSAVRSAMVGVETVPDVSARAAEELNDYVELVEDFEEQLYTPALAVGRHPRFRQRHRPAAGRPDLPPDHRVDDLSAGDGVHRLLRHELRVAQQRDHKRRILFRLRSLAADPRHGRDGLLACPARADAARLVAVRADARSHDAKGMSQNGGKRTTFAPEFCTPYPIDSIKADSWCNNLEICAARNSGSRELLRGGNRE